jgi:dipeptidyl-peptidase-4
MTASAPDEPVPGEAFPIEEVAKYPLPGTSIPGSIRFSPDGSKITYLQSPDGTLTRDLYIHDPASGTRTLLFTPPEGGATEENLSQEEKLVRERMRMRSLGVTSYAWARDKDRFLVPVRGDIWVQDGEGEAPRKVVDGDGPPALHANFSRDGEWIAFVRDDEVYVVSAERGEPRQITRGARGTSKTHGQAEYIAQEEMGRHTGLWWSHDGEYLAFTEVDESHIPIYRIEHLGKDRPTHEDHGYPFAGEANAKVRLAVVRRTGGAPRWLDLHATGVSGDSGDLYLARVHFMPDGSLFAEVQNREQTRLDLVRYDLRSGAGTLVLSETSEVWINLHGVFEPLDEVEGELAGGFLWASERTGFRHLYAYDAKGQEVRALTSGDWMVDGVEGVDQARGWVYFTGTKDGPTQKQLYRVSLQGGAMQRLTTEPGMHGIVMDRDCTRFVDEASALTHPTKLTIFSLQGDAPEDIGEIAVDPDPRVEALQLEPPELVTLTTRDGTTLHGSLYAPAGEGPFPTIVSVYGGPHAQRVQDSWGQTVDMRAQYLRGLGYLVFKLDNRGSARRGLAFEGAIKHDMGNLEVRDQVEGVQWLAAQGLADPERVGIYGWSYGGYMSAMALVRAPDTFKVAVAGAPVTHWDGYDTHYTERYMGTPQSNPEGYAASAVMTHVDALRGKLMLVHGGIDENVHFRHTARLINALVAARKDYDLLLFPDERHMPRREDDRVYMEQRVRDHFRENL